MKRTKIKEELKELTNDQLREKLESFRKEYFTLKLNAANAQVKDHSQFKELRKNIARTLTYLQSVAAKLKERD